MKYIQKIMVKLHFIKQIAVFKKNKEVLDYIEGLGKNVKVKCHEISFKLIKDYENFKAVTSACKMGIEQNYYHSFVLDENNNVIDFTENVVMKKEDYYMFQGVQYKDYLKNENHKNFII